MRLHSRCATDGERERLARLVEAAYLPYAAQLCRLGMLPAGMNEGDDARKVGWSPWCVRKVVGVNSAQVEEQQPGGCCITFMFGLSFSVFADDFVELPKVLDSM